MDDRDETDRHPLGFGTEGSDWSRTSTLCKVVLASNSPNARGCAVSMIASAGTAAVMASSGTSADAPKRDDDAGDGPSKKSSGGKDEVYAGGESGAYNGNASSSSLAVPFSWYIWQYAGTWPGPDGIGCEEPSSKGDGSKERG